MNVPEVPIRLQFEQPREQRAKERQAILNEPEFSDSMQLQRAKEQQALIKELQAAGWTIYSSPRDNGKKPSPNVTVSNS